VHLLDIFFIILKACNRQYGDYSWSLLFRSLCILFIFYLVILCLCTINIIISQVHFGLDQHAELDYIVLAHWNNSLRIDMSLNSDTLCWFRANLLSGEATDTNFIFFDMRFDCIQCLNFNHHLKPQDLSNCMYMMSAQYSTY
jgi:hypothetical protein